MDSFPMRRVTSAIPGESLAHLDDSGSDSVSGRRREVTSLGKCRPESWESLPIPGANDNSPTSSLDYDRVGRGQAPPCQTGCSELPGQLTTQWVHGSRP